MPPDTVFTMLILSSVVKLMIFLVMSVAFSIVISSFVSAFTTARAYGTRPDRDPLKSLTDIVRSLTAVYRPLIVVRSLGVRLGDSGDVKLEAMSSGTEKTERVARDES